MLSVVSRKKKKLKINFISQVTLLTHLQPDHKGCVAQQVKRNTILIVQNPYLLFLGSTVEQEETFVSSGSGIFLSLCNFILLNEYSSRGRDNQQVPRTYQQLQFSVWREAFPGLGRERAQLICCRNREMFSIRVFGKADSLVAPASPHSVHATMERCPSKSSVKQRADDSTGEALF